MSRWTPLAPKVQPEHQALPVPRARLVQSESQVLRALVLLAPPALLASVERSASQAPLALASQVLLVRKEQLVLRGQLVLLALALRVPLVLRGRRAFRVPRV